MKKLVGVKSIKKIQSVINKVLDTHCEIVYNDEETVYVNTRLCCVPWDLLKTLPGKGVNVESVNTDDDAEGFVVLMIDLRTDEEKKKTSDLDSILEDIYNDENNK